jgi:hypothetical protein
MFRNKNKTPATLICDNRVEEITFRGGSKQSGSAVRHTTSRGADVSLEDLVL